MADQADGLRAAIAASPPGRSPPGRSPPGRADARPPSPPGGEGRGGDGAGEEQGDRAWLEREAARTEARRAEALRVVTEHGPAALERISREIDRWFMAAAVAAPAGELARMLRAAGEAIGRARMMLRKKGTAEGAEGAGGAEG